jgi:hypothetical protein
VARCSDSQLPCLISGISMAVTFVAGLSTGCVLCNRATFGRYNYGAGASHGDATNTLATAARSKRC